VGYKYEHDSLANLTKNKSNKIHAYNLLVKIMVSLFKEEEKYDSSIQLH